LLGFCCCCVCVPDFPLLKSNYWKFLQMHSKTTAFRELALGKMIQSIEAISDLGSIN